ncbi:SMI1/KNR4 family protein [Faecalibacter bovis]|uniref:SMI1/KNR4 family protein n=1 Tax=Faecalibacter bovis TaxID=2898187 RepID=A0ABX7XB35_9FLAO|nr:SMI1/KNR4 family protein [Faecalibacter bovis]QTV05083.1 SMI1/KNR4 family protein [Faecalibacter bovis]
MKDYNDFWEDNYYNHPKLTDEMIELAERKLNIKLPQTYINLLKIMNGGYTKGFAFPMNEKTSWSENHIPLDTLNGIVIDENIKTAQNLLDTEYMTNEWGLPEKQVLLSGNGHYWVTLDYRNNSNPSIRWIDVEMDEDIHIANNFDEFLNGLVSDEFYDDINDDE